MKKIIVIVVLSLLIASCAWSKDKKEEVKPSLIVQLCTEVGTIFQQMQGQQAGIAAFVKDLQALNNPQVNAIVDKYTPKAEVKTK